MLRMNQKAEGGGAASMTGRLVVPEQAFQYRVPRPAAFGSCWLACCSEAFKYVSRGRTV